jgi:hypothetical protein
MVTWYVPGGLVIELVIVIATETGLELVGVTTFDGWNWHAVPAGNPEQESVTCPLNAPAPDTTNETGTLLAPGGTFTEVGEGTDKLKSTTCRINGNLCAMFAGSVPAACRLKE